MENITREQVYQKYVEHANDTGHSGWYFLPASCRCYSCGFDFFKTYGEKLGKMFPTGCPKCNRSFVD